MPVFERQGSRAQHSHLVSPAKPDRAMPQAAHTRHQLLARHQVLGNQAMQRLLRSRVIQAKLTINQPGDQYEQEADRVADAVMQGSGLQTRQGNASSTLTSFASAQIKLQRKCACGGTPGPDGECAECRAKRLSLQRYATDYTAPVTAPPAVHEVL